MKRWVVLSVVWVLAAPFGQDARASGMLIPKDESVPPLAVKYQRVDIRIKDGVANAKVEQVFKSSVKQDLEAVYVFPLPENAAIADFAMHINGKRMKGELVQKDEAKRIYTDIVRRMKDPGLLEHMGGNLFRINVYPVPGMGEQKIEIEYSHALEFEAGLYQFVYPLRTGEKASSTLEDFTVSVRLSSAVPIKTVYSPSHKVAVTRKGDSEATVGFEQDKATLDRDFVLYYGVSDQQFGVNLLTHAAKGKDGFFLMMLAPAVSPADQAAMKKDVAFVFDTSGSMAGKKIEQTRRALEYCIEKLNDGDRFNVVRFSTDVETFDGKLVEVTPQNREKALEFVRKIEARGGTDIGSALAAALALDYDRRRPNIVVFLTDGKPTIGETENDPILAAIRKKNTGEKGESCLTRVFVFGVGDEVNTHLLDRMASANGGMSRYVKPEEDIEVKVSSLSDKISHPVLAAPRVTVDKLKLKQVHPQVLPDLFRGDQVTVLGRYEGEGHVAIRLAGKINGREQEFVFEGTFPPESAENPFVPRLWATRRVGYLLDEIRLRGEDKELKDEVLRLSREYGIMTPYTSYLVLENDQEYRQRGIARGAPDEPSPLAAGRDRGEDRLRVQTEGGGVAAWGQKLERPAASAPGPAASGGMVPVFDEADAVAVSASEAARKPDAPAEPHGRPRVARRTAEEVRGYLDKNSGREAVEVSETIEMYKRLDVSGARVAQARHVASRVFYFVNGTWIDREYARDLKTVRVKFASDEYFRWLERRPDLRDCFALGEKLVVCLDHEGSRIVLIVE